MHALHADAKRITDVTVSMRLIRDPAELPSRCIPLRAQELYPDHPVLLPRTLAVTRKYLINRFDTESRWYKAY